MKVQTGLSWYKSRSCVLYPDLRQYYFLVLFNFLVFLTHATSKLNTAESLERRHAERMRHFLLSFPRREQDFICRALQHNICNVLGVTSLHLNRATHRREECLSALSTSLYLRKPPKVPQDIDSPLFACQHQQQVLVTGGYSYYKTMYDCLYGEKRAFRITSIIHLLRDVWMMNWLRADIEITDSLFAASYRERRYNEKAINSLISEFIKNSDEELKKKALALYPTEGKSKKEIIRTYMRVSLGCHLSKWAWILNHRTRSKDTLLLTWITTRND